MLYQAFIIFLWLQETHVELLLPRIIATETLDNPCPRMNQQVYFTFTLVECQVYNALVGKLGTNESKNFGSKLS